MVRSIISIIFATIIILVGAIYENHFVKKHFNELTIAVETIYEKTESETATVSDILSLQKSWEHKKKTLHAFIPHNEIKEFDMWIGETVTLIQYEKYDEALSRLSVVLELAKEVPKTFGLSWANIL